MRDINVTKYRKLLHRIQYFCTTQKYMMSVYFTSRRKTTDTLTDYENGYLNGRHSAFNDVLRELEIMIRDANGDWNNTHCREENNRQENLFDINNRLFSDTVDFSLNKLIDDIKINPTQNTRFCLGVINRVREVWKKIKIHGIETKLKVSK